MKKLTRYSALFIVFAMGGCQWFGSEGPEGADVIIARVDEHYLYQKDIEKLVANSKKDSAQIVSGYIDEWVKRKLLIEKAKLYLPEKQMDVEKQVQDYRESLILYFYEQELLKQKLNEEVSDKEYSEIYHSNIERFKLSKDVLQFYYIKLPIEVPKLDEIKAKFNSFSEEDKHDLAEFCFQYAEEFSLNDTSWVIAETVAGKMKIDNSYLKSLSTNNKSGEQVDSAYIYLFRVSGYIEAGKSAPLGYVKDDIKMIILNKRKKKLLNNTYESVYRDGISKNRFKIY